MEGHNGAANAVVECRGRLASAGDDGVIKLWGAGSWACEVTVHNTSVDNSRDRDEVEESSQRVGVMSLEVSGERLISGGDDSVIRIWYNYSYVYTSAYVYNCIYVYRYMYIYIHVYMYIYVHM
jgi:WD40 repeat protein